MSVYDEIELHGLRDATVVPDIADAATLSAIAELVVRSLTVDLDEAGLGPVARSIGWSVVNLLHRQVEKAERRGYEQAQAIKQLLAEQDGSEVKDLELQEAIERQRRDSEIVDALAVMREAAAEAFAAATGEVWLPHHGTRTGPGLTAAIIDGRARLKALAERAAQVMNPPGPRIIVTGCVKQTDAGPIFDTLDRVHARHPDMVLLHKGSAGVERIAGLWARLRGVTSIVIRPDWALGRQAPFKANDDLLAHDPKPIGLVVFGGEGVAANLAQKAHRKGVRVMTVVEPGVRAVAEAGAKSAA
jgi:hypothetical protein